MRFVELILSYSKQVQQKKTEDPIVCESDEFYDGIEEGRKMAVAAKLDHKISKHNWRTRKRDQLHEK